MSSIQIDVRRTICVFSSFYIHMERRCHVNRKRGSRDLFFFFAVEQFVNSVITAL